MKNSQTLGAVELPAKSLTARTVCVGAVIAIGLAALIPFLMSRDATPVARPDSGVASPVTVALAQQVQWPSTIDASGAVAPWHEASVGAQVPGLRLAEIRVNVGDIVKRGQVLARFDTEMLHAEQAQLAAALAQAEATVAQADANRQRALQLRSSGGISEQDVLLQLTQARIAHAQVAAVRAQLDAKRLQLRYAEVIAPDDGEISARGATLGAVVASGQELFRIIRRGRLEWRGEVTASQLTPLKIGQRVELKLPDGRIAHAQLSRIAPSLEPSSRLGLVYADLGPDTSARAGMYVDGKIVLGESAAVIVPAASVVIRDGRSYVFTLRGEGNALVAGARAVLTGRRVGASVEIVDNLRVGERVALQGAGFLDDGESVRIVQPAEAPVVSGAAMPGATP